MHGVKRDRTQQSAELRAQRKEKEAKKLKLYLDVERRFFDARTANDVSLDALETTTELLGLNPELYTVWNYRRHVLQHLFVHHEGNDDNDQAASNTQVQPTPDFFASARIKSDSTKEHEKQSAQSQQDANKASLLQVDLELTVQSLQVHPKVYWIWNHRKWCLQELPSNDADGTQKWSQEIAMVNKMLEFDARNFHGWDYRRFILSQLALPKTLISDETHTPSVFPQSLFDDDKSLPEALRAHQLRLAQDEIKYTLRKIESNFSNFSAWHQRSLFLPAIWSAQGLDEQAKRVEKDKEFELIRQAMFVDPDDESVWTYHDWLVSLDVGAKDVLDREIASIRELFELEPESRWCINALAHYLIMRQGKQDINEARILLQTLQTIDPNRRQRYADAIVTLQNVK